MLLDLLLRDETCWLPANAHSSVYDNPFNPSCRLPSLPFSSIHCLRCPSHACNLKRVCYVERLRDIGFKRGRCLQCVLSKRKPPLYTSFGCRVFHVRLCKTGCFQTFHYHFVFWMYLPLIKVFVKMLQPFHFNFVAKLYKI